MEFAQIASDEKTIDHVTCPGCEEYKDSIRLVEGTLSDNSKVYSLLVGNVRIECVSERAADRLLTDLGINGEFSVFVDV